VDSAEEVQEVDEEITTKAMKFSSPEDIQKIDRESRESRQILGKNSLKNIPT
jgi:hypothetical protein